MRTLPVSFLYSEGPIARAYLGMLLAAGLQPQCVVHLISENDAATGKPAGRILPPPARRKYCAWLHDRRMNHWPRRIRSSSPDLFRTIADTLVSELELPEGFLDDLVGRNPLETPGLNVLPFMVTGLRDARLKDFLSERSPATFIYSGGGLVPGDLLQVEGLQVLHVHPGLLPHIRGSDGLLWSTLLRGKPAASSLFLVPEIDMGPIVLTREFEALAFDMPGGAIDDDLLYRAVYSYYDPIVRARHLLDTLRLMEGGDPLPHGPQVGGAGFTYRFMSRELRHHALARLFAGRS